MNFEEFINNNFLNQLTFYEVHHTAWNLKRSINSASDFLLNNNLYFLHLNFIF